MPRRCCRFRQHARLSPLFKMQGWLPYMQGKTTHALKFWRNGQHKIRVRADAHEQRNGAAMRPQLSAQLGAHEALQTTPSVLKTRRGINNMAQLSFSLAFL